jgi:NADH-quinone oxidoreductase subunit J
LNTLDLLFFGVCALLALVGGIITVAARNPIRSAMGLLTTILGIAGLYLMLSAEFLAAVQIIVYAGAVVVLFIFVIMLLGPAAQSSPDARSSIPRYIGAGIFLVAAVAALSLLASARQGALTLLPAPPNGLGTVDAIGHELFTAKLVPFELSGLLLLIAVIGAVAVARGKQVDPTLLPKPAKAPAASRDPVAAPGAAAKEAHS